MTIKKFGLAILLILWPAYVSAQQRVTGAGSAGTADTHPITIQGIASGVPIPVTTASGQNLSVSCASGCSGGTTDADDASIASGQTTGLQLGLGYVYTGSAWVRPLGVTLGSAVTTGSPAPLVGAVGYYSDTGAAMKSTDVALVGGKTSGSVNTTLLTDAAGAPVITTGTTALSVTGTITAVTSITNTVTTTGSGTAGTPAAGVSTVQFADSANPFQDMVCPKNTFRAEGGVTLTATTSTANLIWLVNDGTSTTRTAAGTGLKFYIFSVQIGNSGATNATVKLTQDGAAGVPPVTIHDGWVAPTNTTPFGGSNMTFPSGIFQPTTNRALSVASSASSSSVFVNVQGCVAP